MEQLDMDAFTRIIDDMIEKSHVIMTFESPEGTQDVELKDNIGLGPVAQFFILMKGMEYSFNEFKQMIDKNKMEECVDAILEMLKERIMSEED